MMTLPIKQHPVRILFDNENDSPIIETVLTDAELKLFRQIETFLIDRLGSGILRPAMTILTDDDIQSEYVAEMETLSINGQPKPTFNEWLDDSPVDLYIERK